MSQTWNLPMATTDLLSDSRTVLNDGLASLKSSFSGSTAPGSPVAGQWHYDTDDNKVYLYDGATWNLVIGDAGSAGGGMIHSAGTYPFSGDQSMGGNLLTNLGSGSATTDALQKAQIDGRLLESFVPYRADADPSTSFDMYVMRATAAITIVEAYLIVGTSTSSSAGNKWGIQVRNLTQAEDLISSAYDTNGADLSADAATALGVDQNLTIAAGDILEIQFVATGAPTALDRLCVSLVYNLPTS